MNPLAQTVNQYGQGGIDLATAALQHAQSLNLLKARADQERALQEQAISLRGNEERKTQRDRLEQDFFDRLALGDEEHAKKVAFEIISHGHRMQEDDHRADALVKRLNEAEKVKTKSYFQQHLGLIQKPGEDDEAFLRRGMTGVGDMANTLYGRIAENQDRMNRAIQAESNRLNTMAMQKAKGGLLPDLKKADTKLATLVMTGQLSPEDAIAKVKSPQDRANLSDEWEQIKLKAVEQVKGLANPAVRTFIDGIDNQNAYIEKAYSRLLDSANLAGVAPYLKFPEPAKGSEGGGMDAFLKALEQGTAQPSAAPGAAAAPVNPAAVLTPGPALMAPPGAVLGMPQVINPAAVMNPGMFDHIANASVVDGFDTLNPSQQAQVQAWLLRNPGADYNRIKQVIEYQRGQ